MSDLFAKIYHSDVIDRIPEIGHVATIVYLVLARHADKDGYCWPGVDTIAVEGGMSPRSVSNGTAILTKAGMVTKHKRTASTGATQSNGYRLAPHIPVESDAAPPSTSCMGRVQEVQGEGASDAGPPCTKRRTKKIQLRRTIEEEPLKKKDASLDIVFPDWIGDTPEVRAAITDWVDYKIGRRQKYKDPAGQMSRLLRSTEDGQPKFQSATIFIESVNNSIAANWAGCHPPKGNSGNGRPTQTRLGFDHKTGTPGDLAQPFRDREVDG